MAKNNITDLYGNLTSQDSSNNSNVGKLVGDYLGEYSKSKDADKDAQENLITMILGQEFAERSAEKQNQYNIEAEQREREWNSIGAQAQRARSAGISPIAALGMSSGSSIGTQVSSATGSGTNSSTRSRQSDIAALNSAIDQVNTQIRERQLALEEQRVQNETSVAEAEVAKKESETIAQQFENQIRPMLNELKLDDIETQKIKNSVERAVNSGGTDSLAYKQAMAELENLVKDTSVKEEIKNLTNAQIETEKARVENLESSTALNASSTELNKEKSITEKHMRPLLEQSQHIKNDSDLYYYLMTALTNVPPGSTAQQWLGSLFGRISETDSRVAGNVYLRSRIDSLRSSLGVVTPPPPKSTREQKADYVRKLMKNLPNKK